VMHCDVSMALVDALDAYRQTVNWMFFSAGLRDGPDDAEFR
jgi:hypothetical protein